MRHINMDLSAYITATTLFIGLSTSSISANDFVTSSSCTGSGVIGCRAFSSMNDLLELNEVGVPNTPNRPTTNGKCRWNGGSYNCYPTFDEGDCTHLDSLPPRSQESFKAAKRWSPCYDSYRNAARLTFWNDLGSSVQSLYAIDADINMSLSQIWTQYEIMLSPEYFFSPEGTTSSKLYRIRRKKTENCLDERFADHRFLTISPELVQIGPVAYCTGIGYTGAEANVSLDQTRANHWIRITTHYDITNSGVYFWAYDVTTNQLLAEKFVNTHKGERFTFKDAEMNIKGLGFTHHSTSHDPNPNKPSPNYWLRNTVLSTESINPYPGDVTPLVPESCTSFTYDTWGACQRDNTQTRTIISSTPLNCTGGEPVTTRSCEFGTLPPPSPPVLLER